MLNLFSQTRDRLSKSVELLSYSIVYLLSGGWFDKPQTKSIVPPVIQSIHVRRACNQRIKMFWKYNSLDRRLPKVYIKMRLNKSFVTSSDFCMKPWPQFSVLIQLRELCSGIFPVSQIGNKMATRIRKKARPLVM